MSNMTTQFVAWWGAALATLVFLWDIYKWRTTGPRIRMIVQADMKTIDDPELDGETFIIVSATNIGDRPTTLESMFFVWYSNWWHRIRKKPKQQFYVKNPGLGRSFPYKLEVGERWDGRACQKEETAKLANTGYLMCHLRHASSKRPVAKRILVSSRRVRPDAP